MDIEQHFEMKQFIFCLLLVINIIAFFAFGIDKRKAKRNKWRISEKSLLLLALFGGSAGAWCGMRIWHHKTQHAMFKYGIPAIFIVQMALLLYFGIF